ncbi:MAG: 30S ribosomal protein S27ae [Candidatus Undinarchaeales archaeon]
MAEKLNKRDLYEVSGDSIKRKKKQCPRCGPGIFMAEHSDRLSCGKCGYTEIEKKESKEEKPAKEEKEKPQKKEKEEKKEKSE